MRTLFGIAPALSFQNHRNRGLLRFPVQIPLQLGDAGLLLPGVRIGAQGEHILDVLQHSGELLQPAPDSPTPEEHMITHQNAAQFELFLSKMAPRYRELIELRFFREFSYKEIADQLNLPIGTVKTQIHRAREQLCRYITDHNDRQL